MSHYLVKLLSVEDLTHDVKRFRIERPAGYSFLPGQATEVSVNKPRWKEEKRPFTFTGLPDAADLEFIIKSYMDHDGVTKAMCELKAGDELLIHDVWGAITYKGKGVFIAAGSGVTPFIAIVKQLHKTGRLEGHKLIYSNKTSGDIILNGDLRGMLAENFINVLTREKIAGVRSERIDKNFLKEVIGDVNRHFYICGPMEFVDSVQNMLAALGAKTDGLIVEK
jgi:ferredoxin-NADP reductase